MCRDFWTHSTRLARVTFGHDDVVVFGGTYDILYADVLVMEPPYYVMELWMCDVVAENL
jgi:hypothetical protein